MTIEDITIPNVMSPQPLNRDFLGVYIKSKEISDKATENFIASWEQGIDINSKRGKEIVQKIKEELHTKIFS